MGDSIDKALKSRVQTYNGEHLLGVFWLINVIKAIDLIRAPLSTSIYDSKYRYFPSVRLKAFLYFFDPIHVAVSIILSAQSHSSKA